PVMSEEFHLTFDNEAAAESAARRLSALTVDGEPALIIVREGTRLTAGCGIFKQLSSGATLQSTAGGPTIRFFELFYQGGGIKSGMHHPDGLLWIRLPDRSHAVAVEKVSLRTVAPTILQLLGVPRPNWMPHASLVTAAGERRTPVVASAAV